MARRIILQVNKMGTIKAYKAHRLIGIFINKLGTCIFINKHYTCIFINKLGTCIFINKLGTCIFDFIRGDIILNITLWHRFVANFITLHFPNSSLPTLAGVFTWGEVIIVQPNSWRLHIRRSSLSSLIAGVFI